MPPLMRELFSMGFDASTIKGKLRLLTLLAVLGCLFNGTEMLTGPYRAFVSSSVTGSPTNNAFIEQKIAHPFEPLDLPADANSHANSHWEKLAFRFVPFLIANILRIDQRGLICLQILLGIMFPLLLWKILFQATKSAALSTSGVVLINGLYLGVSFFFDTVFFDSFAFFFLLCAMLPAPRWVSLAFLLGAGFTDERALLASFLVPIWRLFAAPDATIKQAGKEAVWQIAFLVSYALLRIAIGAITGLETDQSGVGFEILRLNLPNIVLLVWSVFEGGWVIIVLAAFRLLDFGSALQRFLAGAAAVCAACIFLAGMLVADSIRSQQYAFPLLLIAIVVAGRQRRPIPQRVMTFAIALTLITPITIYLGFEAAGNRALYNLYLLKPGYLRLFGF